MTSDGEEFGRIVVSAQFVVDKGYMSVCLNLRSNGEVTWYLDEMRETYD